MFLVRRSLRSSWIRCLTLLLAATLAHEARATHGGSDLCQCAFGDGLFTLAAPGSITLDGAFGDWGVVAFADGVEASGLTYTFISLASGADDLEFSNDGGATFSYLPVPDAGGFDASVTQVRVNPKGVFAATTALTDPNSPSFNLTLRIRVD